MAYSELIKNFQRTRDYMRNFFVYGFRSRQEYNEQSLRSYDDERRRIESWLGDCMSFRQDAAGKRMFLSVDSRRIPRNPLHKAFKTKSFTDRDITLHFYLLDILADGSGRGAGEIMDIITDRYLSRFDRPFPIDESTVRKKLREYTDLGLLTSEKRGKSVLYRRADEPRIDLDTWADALAFFSEASPLGVVGSFLLDRLEGSGSPFRFKHHYILHTLDSDILCRLLQAIGEHRAVSFTARSLQDGREYTRTVCPLRIYVSTQGGRQYLLGYHYRRKRMAFFRLDAIRQVTLLNEETRYPAYEDRCEAFRRYLWGVSAGAGDGLEHIEMTVRAGPGEAYIVRRLEREKRCGAVVRTGPELFRFSADVYDAREMLPWLRTFTGRIEDLQCSNPAVTDTFREDMRRMAALYGGDGDALQ